MAQKKTLATANIQLTKAGPNGRPVAEILIDDNTSLEKIVDLQKHIFESRDLLKKVGLRGCLSCMSGLDIIIRRRFDHVIQVDLESLGP
ncbi:hypothetical protein [Archangium lansingense]|uniref:Uncharacterized protein n=1 Tax=Archangium lansingense TaxID=2995310 RepID=A0ABT4AME6_9BACT|nr:hypothetical protein [Archangium lansinium]MCY1082859.1 hypothetical protein [Archangium lansinium]